LSGEKKRRKQRLQSPFQSLTPPVYMKERGGERKRVAMEAGREGGEPSRKWR